MPKTTPFATIDNIHPGDTVYSAMFSGFDKWEDINARPYTVTRVNNTSFYVIPEDSKAEIRHSLRTGKRARNVSFGYYNITTRTLEEFEAYVAEKIAYRERKIRVAKKVANLSPQQLKDVEAFINQLPNN